MKSSFRIYNILRPFGWLYGLITGIRNRLYDLGILKTTGFQIPVISIGNISVGGTGKTPHTEYIASLLKDRYKTAVLSRGYGRHTKGFFVSDNRSDSGLIGDEPLQIKTKYPDLDVAVCEDRVMGIRRLSEICSPDVILLDDAYQHRSVTPSLNILLINSNRNIMHDAMLPAGRLRESARGRSRADIIIVSKCPDGLTDDIMDSIARDLKLRPEQQVYFTSAEYGGLYPLDGVSAPPPSDCPVLAVTGIADPAPLQAELKSGHSMISMLNYPDHHEFTRRDMDEIEEKLKEMPSGTVIVTTAKDAARLSGMELKPELACRIFILPVRVKFLRHAERFNQQILQHVQSFKKQ